MKPHAPIPESPSRTLRRLGWLLLLPALALSLHAQPTLTITDGAVITWPASATNYIVQWAPTLEGPWIPCLDPVADGLGYCAMAVECTGECKYFRLARGQRFEDDFNDGDLEGWTVVYEDPQVTNCITIQLTNGQLRIDGTCPGISRMIGFYRTNLVLADCALSIDIHGWDESYPDDSLNIVLFGRLDTNYVGTADNFFLYAGGVRPRRSGGTGSSSKVWIWEAVGSQGVDHGELVFAKMDPAKNYRLVFYSVGPELTVQLFNLTDGAPPVEYTASDSSLTEGWVGFWVRDGGPSGTVDFWLDNFIAVGTTP